jgi:hypothetical protein
MTLFNNYTVEYFYSNAWIEIDELQELTCTVGRKNFTDDWSASQATFRFRYPTGFASPLSDIKIGTPIRFSSPNSIAGGAWSGYVKDVEAEWGMPYQSGVGNADYLIISGEGALGQWGRTAGTGFTPSSALANAQLTEVTSHYGFNWNGNLTSEPVEPVATDSTLLDWFQSYANTVQARVLDGYPQGTVDDIYRRGNVFLLSNASFIKAGVNFSDVDNDIFYQVYDVLDFDSLADNFYTQAIVTSPVVANQIAAVGSAPYKSFTKSTYARTVAQAADLAGYLLAQGQTEIISPTVISCVSSSQDVALLDTLGGGRFVELPYYYIDIKFRGVQFEARIEGATLTATPEQTRVTYNLSSQEANPFFILNDPNFGVLDQNKLGLYVY